MTHPAHTHGNCPVIGCSACLARSEDILPSRDEMVAEILARPNLDPTIRSLFDMLNKSAMRRIERLADLWAKEPATTFVRKARYAPKADCWPIPVEDDDR